MGWRAAGLPGRDDFDRAQGFGFLAADADVFSGEVLKEIQAENNSGAIIPCHRPAVDRTRSYVGTLSTRYTPTKAKMTSGDQAASTGGNELMFPIDSNRPETTV